MSIRTSLTMSPAPAVRLIALFAALLIVSAYALEFGLGVKPCELCWLQRYAHWALLAAALLVMVQPKIDPRRGLKFLIGVALVGIGFAVYHSLVEAHILVAGCSKPIGELASSPAEMIALLADSPMPSCDKPYQILWLSLPQWNVLAQGLVVVFALFTLNRKAVKTVAKVVPVKKPTPVKKTKPVAKKKPATKKKNKR
jgi:disulfide bond formation protein DsbB